MRTASEGPVFTIEDIVIDPAIASLRFRCDLRRCKGACCTRPGGRGAPLVGRETEELERAFPAVKKYLSLEHLAVIDRRGLYEGEAGDTATVCVGDKECVFVAFDEGIATCSLETAYFNGETSWRKPISCHLFPIRIDHGLRERMRFEYFSDCEPALELGESTNVFLLDFLKEALVRALGNHWFQEIQKLQGDNGTDGEEKEALL